jgi:hypothetical protein
MERTSRWHLTDGKWVNNNAEVPLERPTERASKDLVVLFLDLILLDMF